MEQNFGTIKLKSVAISVSPTISGNTLYFKGSDSVVGSELWKTDGTIEGTVLVKDINAGAISSYPSSLTDVNGTLFFYAYDSAQVPQLWKSNGTSGGTILIKNIDTAGTSLGFIVVAGNKIFFTTWGKLWSSDGTSEGTGTVINDDGSIVTISAGLTGSGNRIFFDKYTYQYGYELWTADASQIVLPVSLLSFTAALNNKDVIAQWQTASEINTAYFTVQRSTNAVHFTDAGKVTAKGNSNTLQQYSFPDVNIANLVSAKTVYYRLQTTDKDGAVSFSKVVPIDLKWKDVMMVLHPNPAKNVLKIKLNNYAGNAVIDLYDLSGKKLHTKQQTVESGNDIVVNVAMLEAGVYIIKVNIDGKVLQQNFVKE